MVASKNPILMLVEDDYVDIELVRRGAKKRDLPYEIRVQHSGQDALAFLRGSGFTQVEREQLIVFLDINMPGMNGHQFLDELRDDPMLRRTIVFMLTTSDHVRDKVKAYDRNVAGYFTKANLDGLLDTISTYAENVEYPPVEE